MMKARPKKLGKAVPFNTLAGVLANGNFQLLQCYIGLDVNRLGKYCCLIFRQSGAIPCSSGARSPGAHVRGPTTGHGPPERVTPGPQGTGHRVIGRQRTSANPANPGASTGVLPVSSSKKRAKKRLLKPSSDVVTDFQSQDERCLEGENE